MNRSQELQRAQEVQNVLLLAGGQLLVEDCLHGGGFPTVALMRLDSTEQVAATTVVEEEDALAQAQQGGCAELVAAGAALGDVVCQYRTHVVDIDVREQAGSSVAQPWRSIRGMGGERRRMYGESVY